MQCATCNRIIPDSTNAAQGQLCDNCKTTRVPDWLLNLTAERDRHKAALTEIEYQASVQIHGGIECKHGAILQRIEDIARAALKGE